MVTQGCHVDVSITHSASPRASRPRRWLTIAKTGTMKPMLQAVTRVVEVTQPSVDTEARWIKKSGKSVFGFISRDLCKIQRIIKFVAISDFFVSIAIFFSHFLAEITRTITFIDHHRLRRRICPMIAIVSAY